MIKHEVSTMIPCNSDHFAKFTDGKRYRIIGWATRKTTKTINGDVEKVDDVAGLITLGDQVVFADSCDDFIEYEQLSKQKNGSNGLVNII